MHENHRLRLRRRYQTSGLDDFEDHNILELLLFSSIPRKDTNPIAHRLIDRFGSLRGVFAATEEELCSVEGVGIVTARMITSSANAMIFRILRGCVISLAGTDIAQRRRLSIAAHWCLWEYKDGAAVAFAYDQEGEPLTVFFYESDAGKEETADGFWELIEEDLQKCQAAGCALVFCGVDKVKENMRRAIAGRIPLLFRLSPVGMELVE